MIKCVDKGIWTCIGRNGVPKKSYLNDKSAISGANIVNEKDRKQNTKLVAYKCKNCNKYHLLTVSKKMKYGERDLQTGKWYQYYMY